MNDGVVRVEVELSMGWGAAHPDLFVASMNKFAADYHFIEWKHSIDFSRDGFVTLTAVRRVK